MKTSKLLLSSLLAAAAMSANVFGVELSGTADGTGTVSGATLNASTKTYSITLGDNDKANTVGVLSIEDDYTVCVEKQAWCIFDIGSAANLTGTGTLQINRINTGAWHSLTKITSGTNFAGTIKISTSGNSTNHTVNLSASAASATLNLANSGIAARVAETNVSIAGLDGVAGSKIVSKEALADTTDNNGNSSAFSDATNDTTARTLNIAGSGTYDFAGTFGSTANQSSLNLTKSGTGTQTLSGTTYLGNLDVSGGELVLSGTANIAGTTTVSGGELTLSGTANIAGTTTVGNGATLDLSGGTITLANAIQNSGTVTVSGTTVFNLTDSLKNAEGVYTLISNSGSGNITNWTADILSWRNFTLAGEALSGRTQITLGAGSVTFSGEAYNLFWKGGNGEWNTTTATNFGKDSVDGADTAFVSGDNVTFSSSATVDVSRGIRADVVSITGTVDAPTTLTLTNQANLTANSIHIGDNATLALGNLDDSVNVSHKLTGTGTVSVSKTGANKNHDQIINFGTEFAGTVEYSGNLNPTNATFGSAAAKVNFTNVWFWSDDGTATIAQVLNFSGAENKNTKGTVNLTGGMTFSKGASFSVSNGTVNVSGSVTDGAFSQSGGTLSFNVSGNTTIKSLTKSGGTLNFTVASGTTSFQGNSSVTRFISYGTTRVEGGATLNITGTDTGDNASQNWGTFEIGSGSSVNVAADFDLSAWASGNSANDVSKTLTVGENAFLTVAGKVRNRTGLTLTNDGTISVGTFYYGSTKTDSVSGSGVVAADKFEFSNSGTYNFSGVTLKVGSGGIQADATANNNYGFNLNFGAVKILLTADSETAAFTAYSDSYTNHYKLTDATTGTTYDTNGFSMGILQAIEGSGKLVKAGAGTLTLRGANTYTGGTVIEAGTVVAGHASALGGGNVTVADGATLNLGTSAVTVAGLSGAGMVGLANGTTSSTLTVNSATDSTFRGAIGNAVSLVKQGTGTLELSGMNYLYSFTEKAYQNVSVNAGTLRIVTNTQATTHAGATTVASGAALEVSVSESVSVSLTSVSISEGGKLIIDLSNYASATETFALNIITASALSYNGVDFAEDCTSLIGSGAVELKGWTQTGWTKSLSYVNDTLSLTMTIPEPSVFGLLAGLGALALAGTRRRRQKKA